MFHWFGPKVPEICESHAVGAIVGGFELSGARVSLAEEGFWGDFGVLDQQIETGCGSRQTGPGTRLTATLRLIRSPIWFSTEDDAFSETLGELLGNGYLLSDAGRIIRRNACLIRKFSPQPPVRDYGLDAVTFGPDGLLLFSVEEDNPDHKWSESRSRRTYPVSTSLCSHVKASTEC